MRVGAHLRVYVKRFLFYLVAFCIPAVLLASFSGPHPASHCLQYGKVTGSWARPWKRGYCTVTLPPLSSSDDDEGEASHSHGQPSPSHTFTTNHSASSREDLEDETVSVQVQGSHTEVGRIPVTCRAYTASEFLYELLVKVSCYVQ